MSLEKHSTSQGEIVAEDKDTSRGVETLATEEKISSVEEKFELWRGRVGIFLGPALFILVLLLPFPALSSSKFIP